MSHMFLLGPGLRQRFFFALPADFFPLNAASIPWAICSMLNLKAAISTIFATILERSILELEILISAGTGKFWS